MLLPILLLPEVLPVLLPMLLPMLLPEELPEVLPVLLPLPYSSLGDGHLLYGVVEGWDGP